MTYRDNHVGRRMLRANCLEFPEILAHRQDFASGSHGAKCETALTQQSSEVPGKIETAKISEQNFKNSAETLGMVASADYY